MMIDSHCHPQFPQYDSDREEMIKRTLKHSVKMICVGTDLAMSEKAVELAKKYDGIWASVGLHPNDNLEESFDDEAYIKLAQESKVVAIGEIGLDYYRTPDVEKQQIQKERFKKQIRLARDLGKPLIMHCRDAYLDALEILKTNPIEGVAHSFNGSWDLAKRLFDLGLHIGLNGIITFTKQHDEMIKNMPLNKLLLETDAPYLAPVPHRGRRNEPLYLEFIAKRIADVKNLKIEEVIERTTENTASLFKLS